MPLLPPDHVTMPVAAVYLVASILHDNHAPEPGARAPEPFGQCRLTVDRHAPCLTPQGLPLPPRLIRHSLVSTQIQVKPGVGPDRNDPIGFEVAVLFQDREGRPFYRGVGARPVEVTTLELTLRPPVVGCLSALNLRKGLNAQGLVANVAPLPDSIQTRVPVFDERLVTRYRQALAEGLLRAVLVDRNGRSVAIPAGHWREDTSRAGIVQPYPVAMVLDGQEMRGHICANLSELRAGWRQAFAALPVSAPLAEAELPANASEVGNSPFLEFAQYAARNLGIVNGRGPDGLPIYAQTFNEVLRNQWQVYGKFKGPPVDYNLQVLSAMLRHPDDKAGQKRWSTLGREES